MNTYEWKRVIKFRAWSEILKLMTYDIKISDIKVSGTKADGDGDDPDSKDPKYVYLNDIIDHYQKLFILMQYIGAKDKYDRDIYEGDVVKWIYPYYNDCLKSDEIYGVVEWDERDCQFKIRQLTDGFYDIGCGSKEKLTFYGDERNERNFEFQDLQVIGNIYKNPELLNIGEKIKEDKMKEEKMRENKMKEEKKKKGIEIRKITTE